MVNKKRIELDDTHGRSIALEEFVFKLHKSTELLNSNQANIAQKYLKEAFCLQKDNPEGRANLALVYFKLGLYPRAISLYEELLEEMPNDPVLLLNLSLVLFKTGHTVRTKDLLEKLVKLSPNYRKAYGYLGLACQRLGEYARAQEVFKKAGADHMAARMAKFIEPAKDQNEHSDLNLKFDSEFSVFPNHSYPSNDLDDQSLEKRSSIVPPCVAQPPYPSAEFSNLRPEPLPISALSTHSRFNEPLSERFLIADAKYLIVTVTTKVFSQMNGLLFCSSKGLSYKATKKHLPKDNTEEILGIQAKPVHEISGEGRLGFYLDKEIFSAVSFNDEIAHLREEFVFAFDSELSYENGYIPGSHLPMVRFNGKGSIVFKSLKPPQYLEVTSTNGVIIAVDGLIGWLGCLVSKPVSNSLVDSSVQILEFMGEGVLVFCLP